VTAHPVPHPRPRPEALAVDLHGIGDLAGFAILVAESLESTADSTLARDAVGLRRVVRRGRIRTAAQESAEARVRRSLAQSPPRSGNLRSVASTLQLIAELGHVSDLIDLVARAGAADTSSPLSSALRRDLHTLRTFGGQRLRCIAVGLPRPVMDARYLPAGNELRAVAERVRPHPGQDSSGAAASGVTVDAGCSAIAAAILLASLHVTRTV
jgi:hypothetical protein